MAYTTTGKITLKLPTSVTVRFTDEAGNSHEKLFSCADTFSYNEDDEVTVIKQFGQWSLVGADDPIPGFRRKFWDKG
jgi:hypothetical protein